MHGSILLDRIIHLGQQAQRLQASLYARLLAASALTFVGEHTLHALSVRGTDDACAASCKGREHEQRRRLHLEIGHALPGHLFGEIRKADRQLRNLPPLAAVEAG